MRWPDFGTPWTEEARAALGDAYERSTTERAEIACGGGVGRAAPRRHASTAARLNTNLVCHRAGVVPVA